MDKETEKILSKYRKKVEDQLGDVTEYKPDPNFSKEYITFKKEALNKRISTYEKLCKVFGNLKFEPSQKDRKDIEEAIEFAHLDITANQAYSFAIFSVIILILVSLFAGLLPILLGQESIAFLFGIILMLFSLLLLKPLTRIPVYIADSWRLKASNQMVLCILYMVIYMRHTSNLEHAIKFAADHLGNPLALDLRKVFWDLETGKFGTIKQSLENYLKRWRKYNLEFINAFHLVESSLYEPNDDRRIELLERSLKVILEGIHDRMLHYAQELKNPITMLHMLGVILPILTLIIFPLVGTLMQGSIKWYHMALIYNLILPVAVYFYGKSILSKRPTGYGESQFGYDRKVSKFGPVLLGFFFVLIGFSPLIMHAIDPEFDIFIGDFMGNFLGYYEGNGPFGIGALALSLFVPLGIALGMAVYYRMKSGRLIKVRNETKKMENEFSGALFQLGTRIGDGIPTEIALEEVGNTLSDTPTGLFFKRISNNIRKLGMNLYEAIFNKKNGAILGNPSALIESAMEVIVESAKKGPQIVSRSVISISNYITNINRVNERLKDLLSEIISSMKSQIKFLAPVIAGIVVGLSAMMVTIITRLSDLVSGLTTEEAGEFGGMLNFANLFKAAETIPSYYFQLVVGIYVVEIVVILTVLASSIEFGPDKLNEEYYLSRNLISSTLLYVIITFLVSLIFVALTNSIILGVG
ncbi:MAG: hypothetical protein ABH849_04950 [Nanoarchaeota archaeon]